MTTLFEISRTSRKAIGAHLSKNEKATKELIDKGMWRLYEVG